MAPSRQPGRNYPLGTDENGFDELGRIMLGGQSALEIGAFAALIAIVIGTLYGAISGLVGGLVDAVMMRFVDILLSIPYLLIVLVLATKYNGTVLTISLILGVFSWLMPARLVRGEVLDAAQARFRGRRGNDGLEPLAADLSPPDPQCDVRDDRQRHVPDRRLDHLPGALGFLGFGLQFPDTSWGDMLGNADQYVQNGQWWLVYPVGGMLVVVVLCAT